MKCIVCNKQLKDPESIKKGIGPICDKKRIKKLQLKLSLRDKKGRFIG